MAFEKGNRPDSPMKRRGGRRRKKVCVFCGKENNEIDYKDTAKLKKYVLSEKHGTKGILYKSAVIGVRLSWVVSVSCCIAGVCKLFL